MGPSAIRCAEIVERLEKLNIEVEDLGDIIVGVLKMQMSPGQI